MHVSACKNIGPNPLPDSSPYPTVSAAVAALTNQDQSWLSHIASRRLRRLRSHPGLARYLAGKEPGDLVDEAIERLQSGTRRTKPSHLATHQAFLNHLQGVINSIANNYTRHAEPHVEHIPLGEGENGRSAAEPVAAQDVVRDIMEREWLDWLFNTLEHSLSCELRAELCRLRASNPSSISADMLVQQCSEHLLAELQARARRAGRPSLEIPN